MRGINYLLCFFNALFCGGMTSRSYGQLPKEVINSIGMELVLIPNGKFTRRQLSNEEDWNGDERPHQVTMTRDYFLGATEVTQAQFQAVMGNNPSFFQGEEALGDSSSLPVETVNWNDAAEFCRRLSEMPEEKRAGRVYSLPTEAEWEYACRAGSNSVYSFGDDWTLLGDFEWYQVNAGGRTHPVGTKKQNAWGLHDMYGNVSEWCADWYGDYPTHSVADPAGPKTGTSRVYRGGSFASDDQSGKSSIRYGYFPTLRNFSIGFRVAMSQLDTSVLQRDNTRSE